MAETLCSMPPLGTILAILCLTAITFSIICPNNFCVSIASSLLHHMRAELLQPPLTPTLSALLLSEREPHCVTLSAQAESLSAAGPFDDTLILT